MAQLHSGNSSEGIAQLHSGNSSVAELSWIVGIAQLDSGDSSVG